MSFIPEKNSVLVALTILETVDEVLSDFYDPSHKLSARFVLPTSEDAAEVFRNIRYYMFDCKKEASDVMRNASSDYAEELNNSLSCLRSTLQEPEASHRFAALGSAGTAFQDILEVWMDVLQLVYDNDGADLDLRPPAMGLGHLRRLITSARTLDETAETDGRTPRRAEQLAIQASDFVDSIWIEKVLMLDSQKDQMLDDRGATHSATTATASPKVVLDQQTRLEQLYEDGVWSVEDKGEVVGLIQSIGRLPDPLANLREVEVDECHNGIGK